MKIGLFFGSFNPVHIGHLIIANYIVSHTDLDKIWLVVSPQNPFKKTGSLLNEYDRYHLVQTAVDDAPNLSASNIEFSLPRPSYTIHTLAYLKEKYPEHHFSIILGGDGLENLDKWKNAKEIIFNYPLYVYPRPGFQMKSIPGANITIINAPLLSISSTLIRQLISEGKSIRYFVPDRVFDEIEKGGYYKKTLNNNSQDNKN